MHILLRERDSLRERLGMLLFPLRVRRRRRESMSYGSANLLYGRRRMQHKRELLRLAAQQLHPLLRHLQSQSRLGIAGNLPQPRAAGRKLQRLKWNRLQRRLLVHEHQHRLPLHSARGPKQTARPTAKGGIAFGGINLCVATNIPSAKWRS